jgi:hypothetical protein
MPRFVKQPSFMDKETVRQEARRRRQQADERQSQRVVDRLKRLPAWQTAAASVCMSVRPAK